jgi:hypothetical protein
MTQARALVSFAFFEHASEGAELARQSRFHSKL